MANKYRSFDMLSNINLADNELLFFWRTEGKPCLFITDYKMWHVNKATLWNSLFDKSTARSINNDHFDLKDNILDQIRTLDTSKQV